MNSRRRDRSAGGVLAAMTFAAFYCSVPTAAGGQTPALQTAPPATLSRTTDGKPDLSGIWQAMNTAEWNIQNHEAQKGVPAGLGVVEGNVLPYQPWAAAKQKENLANQVTADSEAKCKLPGLPRITYMPYPFQIFQTSSTVVLLYEYVHAMRSVYLGSQHPPGHIDWWMGDSRGKWDGDTLVVDVIDFNDETWFDRAGNFHSDALHLVERFTPIDHDHLNYEVTVDDPKVFTGPWKMSMPLYRRLDKGMQLLEYECYAFDHPFHAIE